MKKTIKYLHILNMQVSSLGLRHPEAASARISHGPCLKHCYDIPVWLRIMSFSALTYILTCLFYVLINCIYQTPTSFADSLTRKQRELKEDSAQTRIRVFLIALIISIILTTAIASIQRR